MLQLLLAKCVVKVNFFCLVRLSEFIDVLLLARFNLINLASEGKLSLSQS